VTRSIRWRSGDDVEHCELKIGPASVAAEGVLVARANETDFALRYRIVLDADWAGLRSVHVTRLGGATVALRHDGYGEWTDGEGKKRPDLSKCLDLSLGQSQLPFTATIKRFAWKAGKTVELSIIHISTPSLDISRLIVKVTAIEPARLYRVQVEGGEAQEIAVDADGFVRLGEMTEVV
jgi:hypothetical protein